MSHHLELLCLPYLPLFHTLSSYRGCGQAVAPSRTLVSGRATLGKQGRRSIAAEIVGYIRSNMDTTTTASTELAQ